MFINELYYAIKIWKRAHKTMIPPIGKGKDLHILANGPSLRELCENNISYFEDKNVLCVNRMVETEYYPKLKPLACVVIDGGLLGTDRNMTEVQIEVARTFRENIVNKTTWDIYLFLPYASKGSKLAKAVETNKHIHVIYLNTSVYKGKNRAIEYAMWNKFWCCPRMENVLVASVFISILMRFNNIFLYGADHDWIKTVGVDDNNNIFTQNKHLYKEKDTKYPYRINNENRYMRLGELLEEWACVWNTYYKLNDFAKRNGTTIYNATKNSLIDAFARKLD